MWVSTLFCLTSTSELLNKDTSAYKEYTGYNIPKHISRETCKAIILGIGYIDFKSTHLKGVAKKMLAAQFNPSKEIPRPNGRKIDEFFVLRNYLAQYSDAAKRSLERVYNRYALRVFREPGVFLLAEDKGKKLRRMAVYIIKFL